MGTGYVRNDTPNNIADGNVINASDLDGEFDAIQSAFNATTGHSHDGTSGEGPQIDTGGIANDAVTLGTKTTGNYVATGAVSGVGLSGSASSEGATFTITSNATSANTASTIVARDASGNFSAGTVTGALSGNASTATALETARTIAGNSFDGTANITIASTDLSDGSSLLKNVSEDTTPQLGGNLDLNSNDITGTGNINNTGTITTDGLTVDGDVTLNDGSPNLRLQDSDVNRYVDFLYGTRVATFRNTMASGDDIDVVEPSIVFSFKDDGETRTAMTIDHDNNLLVNGTTHVHTGSAGAVTANVDFDDLVVESNGNMGMSFLSPNDTFQQIGFGDADDNDIGKIAYQHTNDSMQFIVNGSERMRITSGGAVGIGTGSPSRKLDVHSGSDAAPINIRTTQALSLITFDNSSDTSGNHLVGFDGDDFVVGDTSITMRLKSSGLLGLGTSSPQRNLHVHQPTASSSFIQLTNTATGSSTGDDGFRIGTDANSYAYVWQGENQHLAFATSNAEKMRLDLSGNLLVGTSTNLTGAQLSAGTTGIALRGDSDQIVVAKDGGISGIFNRNTSDGGIVTFQKDGSDVGTIGIANGDNLFISSDDTNDVGLKFNGDGNRITPCDASGNDRDDAIDLGEAGSGRFDDIYATNGTIQTSDQNEKQQIASLTSAEITAAKAISALFKTFKWNSSVASKGDAARTHTGVIAQQVEQALTDAGLNAGDYAFFINGTWTDDDGVEQSRKGIRYAELLAFVGAATEQRLSDIETRLAALEAN